MGEGTHEGNQIKDERRRAQKTTGLSHSEQNAVDLIQQKGIICPLKAVVKGAMHGIAAQFVSILESTHLPHRSTKQSSIPFLTLQS